MPDLFSDHLQGGKHGNIDEAGRNALAGTPKHNKFSETVFGFMDQLVRSKPNISTLSAEAYVMFANNKTNAWLEEKDASTQQAILKAASLDVRRVRASFKKRRDEIATARRAKVQAALKKELEAKKLQQLEQYTNDIIDFGLWQNEQAVDDELASSTLDSVALVAP